MVERPLDLLLMLGTAATLIRDSAFERWNLNPACAKDWGVSGRTDYTLDRVRNCSWL